MSWKHEVLRGLHSYENVHAGSDPLDTSKTLTLLDSEHNHSLGIAQEGQYKLIYSYSGNDSTVTPTAFKDYTSISFTTEGSWVCLQFRRLKWVVVDHYNVTLNE